MTKDELSIRLETLSNEREQVTKQLAQLNANMNAYNGAIEECRYWLSTFQPQEPSTDIVEPNENPDA